MEDQSQLTLNGQSVLTGDFNTLGQVAALADDRVLAELLRMTPYDGSTVSKGVLPYGLAASPSQGLVAPNGASGAVLVNPFRALIGSRTAEASSAKKNWRDIRSAICVGSTTLAQVVSLAANASGNPRWDLVYAAVVVDGNGASVTRKVKDPTTKVIAGASVVTTLVTSVTLGVVTGVTGASPAFPATPTDSGGTYYVPLAYVRVPTGFGGASTVNKKDVNSIAPVVSLASAVGVSALQPANQHYKPTGTAITGAGTSPTNGALAWGATSNTRAALYLPPTMSGGAGRLIAIDVCDASNANWSHQNNAIVDDSIDWRHRIFKWTAVVGGAAGGTPAVFPWNGAAAPLLFNLGGVGPGYAAGSFGPALASGLGASTTISGANPAVATVQASGAGAALAAAAGSNIPTAAMAASTSVALYVDDATGALKVKVTGVPLCSVFFWLEATAPYANQ